MSEKDFWEGYVPEPVWGGGPTNKDYEDAMRQRRLHQLTTPPARQEPVAWTSWRELAGARHYRTPGWEMYADKRNPDDVALYTSPPAQPVQDNPLDCGVYLGSGKGHEIKHHVSYGPEPVPDAFEQLMREADKPTQVPEGIAKYVDALVKGTHEITSVTIRPKRTWVGLTDDEKLHIEIMGGKSDVMLAEMVEAKLKEKNT